MRICQGYLFWCFLALCPWSLADGLSATQAGLIRIQTIASGLEHPWGLAFLPDGRMLVTERPGRLRIVSQKGQISKPIAGVPKVLAEGHGGLLDVALDPNFSSNQLIYFS